jgi:hypothetical protein
MAEDKWANPQKMWDARFSQTQPVYGEAPNAFLAEQSSCFERGMKLLVAGRRLWPQRHLAGSAGISGSHCRSFASRSRASTQIRASGWRFAGD